MASKKNVNRLPREMNSNAMSGWQRPPAMATGGGRVWKGSRLKAGARTGSLQEPREPHEEALGDAARTEANTTF